MYLRKAASPPAMSAMAFDRLASSSNARGMPPHLIEFESLDMFEFVGDGDQRPGDDAPGKPRRQDAAPRSRERQANEQMPDRRLDRAEKFRLRE